MRHQEEQGTALGVTEEMLELFLPKSHIVAVSGGGEDPSRLHWRAPGPPLGGDSPWDYPPIPYDYKL